MGCPGCGYWRGHEAYLVEGYCPPPLTLHSEKQDVTHDGKQRVNTKSEQSKGTTTFSAGTYHPYKKM